ncbi:MAG: DUF3999 domain-containing protein [Syntrophobacteraceae bacterium]
MRRRQRSRWLLGAWVMVLLAAPGVSRADDPLKPEDFAYAYSLEARMGAPFQEIVLPVDFYRGVTRADLQDSVVFDAGGKSVPHAFRSPGQPSPARMTEWLPVFPVSRRTDRGTGEVTFSFKKAPDGTLVELKAKDGEQAGDRTVAYILDASFLNDPYSALELNFQPSWGSQLFKVTIEGGNDLNAWAVLASSQTIGRLAHEGHSIEKGKVELRPCRYKYLRLTWEATGETLRLMDARAVLAKAVVDDLHEWAVLKGEQQGKEAGYVFDTRGWMPVDRLRVVFPGTNVAVPVKIFSRGNPADPWQFRSEALVHRLSIEGKVYSEEEIRLGNATTDRSWRVEPKMTQEPASLSQTIELHVGWVPKRLVFLVQGTGPYNLAFGSSSRRVAPFPLESLLDRVTPEARNKALLVTAAMSGMHTLGGEAALRPVKPPLPWKQWILWAVLVGGVGLMGWMAFKLHRQLSGGDKGSPSSE